MDDRKKNAALQALHHIQGMVDAADAGKLTDGSGKSATMPGSTAQKQSKPGVDHILHEVSTEEDAPGGVTHTDDPGDEGDGAETIDDSQPVGEDHPDDVCDGDNTAVNDGSDSDSDEAKVDGVEDDSEEMDKMSEPDSGEDVGVKRTLAMLKGRRGK